MSRKIDISSGLAELLKETPPARKVAARMERQKIDLDRDPEFVAGFLKAKVVNDICTAMQAKGITKNKLAALLGKSPQYVGRVLAEHANFTLETIAEFACALGMSANVCIGAATASTSFAVASTTTITNGAIPRDERQGYSNTLHRTGHAPR